MVISPALLRAYIQFYYRPLDEEDPTRTVEISDEDVSHRVELALHEGQPIPGVKVGFQTRIIIFHKGEFIESNDYDETERDAVELFISEAHQEMAASIESSRQLLAQEVEWARQAGVKIESITIS